jgi:serine/threonine-protein kinase RsbW
VSNVVRHGYAGRPGTIRLQLHSACGRLQLSVEDDAPPFDPRARTVDPNRRGEEGGFGLALLKAAVDLRYKAGHPLGNCLTLVARCQ